MDIKTLSQSVGQQVLKEVVLTFFQEQAPSLVTLGQSEVEGILADVWYEYQPIPKDIDGLNEDGWLFIESVIEDRSRTAKLVAKAMRLNAAETKRVRAAALAKLGSIVGILGGAVSGALFQQLPKI